MTRLKRRFLFIAVPLIVVAIIAGAFIQISTRQALERAEAFQFRRMLVSQADDETYRFFYISNRLS